MTAEPYHVALTGHRPVALDGYDLGTGFYSRLRTRLLWEIQWALDQHETVALHSGLALGADTVWSQAAMHAKRTFPERVRFIAERPFPQQADRWLEEGDKLFWREQLDAADQVNTYAETFSNQALHARNAGMVDACNLLLAVWNGSTTGGTASAVAYAKRKGKTIKVLDPELFR